MKRLLILILSLLTINIASAIIFTNYTMEAGTIIFENRSNTTIKVLVNSTADEWDINNSFGGIIIHNITNGSKFENWNATYNGKLGFYDTQNGYFLYDNGTFFYADQAFNVNITLLPYVNITINLDTQSPNVSLVYPTNSMSNKTLTQNFTANMNDTYGLKNSSLFIYNNTGLFNNTITNYLAGTLQKILGIPVTLIDNFYTWWVEVWDYSGNSYTTSNYTLLVDSVTSNGFTTIPGTITTDDYSKEIYINFSELNVDVIKYNWNNTNTTIYDSSVVLMMNFDNRSSLGENDTLVKDISRYGNNGTVYGPVLSIGKYGNAFSLDGINDYINTSLTNLKMDVGSNVSFYFWIKSPQIDSGDRIISDNTASTAKFYDIYIKTATGELGFIFYNSSTNSEVIESSAGLINANWNNLAITINRASNNVSFYSNGVIVQSFTMVSTSNGTGTVHSLKFGSTRTTSQFLNGSIDNLMILNRSLTGSEIAMLYKIDLEKYNSTNWGLNVTNLSIRNENLSTINLNESYDYGLYVNDTAGNSNSTLYTITRVPLLTSTTGNFTTQKGIIRNDFYGVNIQRYSDDSPPYKIDVLGDGSFSGTSNITWHKQGWLNVGVGKFREAVFVSHFYTNTSDSSGVNMSQNMSKIIDEVKFAYDNNKRILLTIYDMPTWLANVTNKCDQDNTTCTPDNYTKWNNIVIDIINRTSNNGAYISAMDIEIWNEPELSIELNKNQGNYNINQSKDYNLLYNQTYTAIKSVYPTIAVGGTATLIGSGEFLFDNFLGNFTTNMDFVSRHIYSFSPLLSGFMQTTVDGVIANCTLYGANCSRIIISEVNVGSSGNGVLIKNQTTRESEYGMQIGSAYIGGLNYATNLSLIFFDWSEYTHYANTTIFPEYPSRYSMVSEPQLDNAYYPPFNVTKNFASYCPSGSLVGSSISNNSYEKTVLTRKGNTVSLVMINTDTEAHNFTSNVSLIGASNLRDLETNTLYNSVNGKLNFGLINGYDILYLANGIYGEYNGAFWNKPVNEITESNVNLTTVLKNTDIVSRTIELANLTNALILYGNNTLIGSADINSNDNGLNVTILSSQNISLLNNFNLTENYNRVNSPVWINSKTIISNLITYKIGNNLTTPVNNISFYPVFTTPCPLSASIIPNGTTTASSLSFLCTGAFLTSVNLTNLNQSTSSNTLYLTYDFGSGGGGPSGGSPSSPVNETNLSSNITIPGPKLKEICNISNDKIFFPLPTISVFKLDSCAKVEKFNKFFRIMYKDNEYKIIGIKMSVVIVLLLIFTVIKLIRRRR